MAAFAANRKQPGGAKHVLSAVPIPGTGPTDASGQVAAHKGVNEGPITNVTNPNRPAKRLAFETTRPPVAPGGRHASHLVPAIRGNY